MSAETIELVKAILDAVDIIGEPAELLYTYEDASLERAAKILDDWSAVERAEEAVKFKLRAEAAEARKKALREALDRLARLGNEPEFGNNDGNMIARAALAGKGEG